MALRYRTSIYTRPRVPARPVYRKVTLLDLMRAERKRDEMEEVVRLAAQNAYLYGVGFTLASIENERIFNAPSSVQ